MNHVSFGRNSGRLYNGISRPGVDPAVLFAVEGALLQLFTTINGFGNNLFATELGATDQQIGLIQTIPNAAAVLLLLPLGMLADRLRSSRTIPLISLLFIAAGYVLMSAVPVMGDMRMFFFFVSLAFTVGGPVLYNAQWQTFFGDVVQTQSRNSVLTLRNRLMFALGIATPLVCGVIMGRAERPIDVFRMFFLVCAIAVICQFGVVSAIRAPERTRQAATVRAGELLPAIRSLAGSREFLLFFIPVVLFYIGWQSDWSMWYIGQVQYLHLTESQMTMYNGIFNMGQLVAIGILSRSVRRRGADRTLPFAALGLMFCPLIMMVCTRIPQAYRAVSFTLMVTLLNAPQCAANLCLVQILLRVAPRQYRNIAVSLYTLTITLMNCFVPYLGVQIYTALGADYRALMLFNTAAFVYRFFTMCLLMLRCRFIKNTEE